MGAKRVVGARLAYNTPHPIHPAHMIHCKPSTVGPRRSALLFLCLGLSLATACQANPAPESTSLDNARAELESGRALLIDIRETDEHAKGVASGARLLPMSQIGARLAEIPADPAQPVLLICNTQNRSRATLKALRERGYTNVRFVDGGMSEWARRGWPMSKPAP